MAIQFCRPYKQDRHRPASPVHLQILGTPPFPYVTGVFAKNVPQAQHRPSGLPRTSQRSGTPKNPFFRGEQGDLLHRLLLIKNLCFIRCYSGFYHEIWSKISQRPPPIEFLEVSTNCAWNWLSFFVLKNVDFIVKLCYNEKIIEAYLDDR